MSKIITFNSIDEVNNVSSQLPTSARDQGSFISAREIGGGKYELEVPDGLVSTVAKADPNVHYPAITQPVISKMQFAHALWKRDLISFDEARAFVKSGEIPAAFTPALDQMPEDEKQETILALEGLVSFNAESPKVRNISEKMGWAWADTVDLWNFASTL